METNSDSVNATAHAEQARKVSEALSRPEWERRYAARLMTRGGMGEVQAIQCAREAAEDSLDLGAMEWTDEPEDAADEEMSYWENDGA